MILNARTLFTTSAILVAALTAFAAPVGERDIRGTDNLSHARELETSCPPGRMCRRRMHSDDVGFASVTSLRAREVPAAADPLVKKDTMEIATTIAYGTDPDGALVEEWYTHGKYRHDKHCPHRHRRPKAMKACRCKHRHHHYHDPTGEGSHAHGSCSVSTVDSRPNPTSTSGNGTVTPEEVTPTPPVREAEVPGAAEPSPTTVGS